MANLSIGSLIAANLSLGTAQIKTVSLGTTQVWAHEVVVVLGNTSNIVLKNLFTSAVWASSTPKRVVIPSGVQVGAVSASYAIATTLSADGQAGSFGGTLILEVHGTVSGIGGAPNSGAGGHAIWGNYPGRDGQKLIVNNYGTIRAGGGGGGRGGTGGGGVWYSGRTVTESPNMASSSNNFYYPDYYWAKVNSENQSSIWWYSTNFPNRGLNDTSYYNGGYTYYRGAFKFTQWHSQGTTDYYYVYRTHVVYDVPNYTSGGSGGSGGRGQGYDGSNASGSSGSAGGTNAGTGGTGGSGGGWGASGNTGNTGGSGNNGGGAAGTAGGPAGGYLYQSSNITLNNSGTLQGRLL